MQILISLLGLGRSFPLITGLLLFSLVGMGTSYYKGRSDVHTAYKAEKAEAIEKDAKENQKLKDQAHKDQLEHQTQITKSNERLKTDVKDIAALTDACLDVALPERLQHP